MNIRSMAKDFSVHLFSNNQDWGFDLAANIEQAGYGISLSTDENEFFKTLTQRPAHLVLFSIKSLHENLNQFLDKILKLSPDSRFLIWCHPSQFASLKAFREFGVMDILAETAEGEADRALWAVDQACEKLYYEFQNEQILEKLEKLEQGPSIPVQQRLANYLTCENPDAVIKQFLQIWEEQEVVYFKFLENLQSLIATHFSKPLRTQENLGYALQSKDLENFHTGKIENEFESFLTTAFPGHNFFIRPLFSQKKLDGIFIFPFFQDQKIPLHIENEFSLMQICFSHLGIEKRLDFLETEDLETATYNQKFLDHKLMDEFERAKQFSSPLSLIKISLDHFQDLENLVGESARGQILKNLADLIRKTNRHSDILARTGVNEFTLLLPHCAKSVAMIRAERIRRMVESNSVLKTGVRCTVSVGLAEYPATCAQPDDLVDLCRSALQHIQEKGGNKLCAAKPKVNYRPDFVAKDEVKKP